MKVVLDFAPVLESHPDFVSGSKEFPAVYRWLSDNRYCYQVEMDSLPQAGDSFFLSNSGVDGFPMLVLRLSHRQFYVDAKDGGVSVQLSVDIDFKLLRSLMKECK